MRIGSPKSSLADLQALEASLDRKKAELEALEKRLDEKKEGLKEIEKKLDKPPKDVAGPSAPPVAAASSSDKSFTEVGYGEKGL